MPKLLVTGGAGFLGYHLARKLVESAYSVDILDNYDRGVCDGALARVLEMPGIRMLQYDLRDPTTAQQLDTDYDRIFHFAAIVGVKNVRSRPYEVLIGNPEMLSTALEIARRQGALDDSFSPLPAKSTPARCSCSE